MKKKNILIVTIIISLIMILSFSYAVFTYSNNSDNSQLITGQVYMRFQEDIDYINLNNMFPEKDENARKREDNVITFSIDGVNTTQNKDIYYEIKLVYGDDISGKTRFKDNELKFDLIEIIGNEENIVLEGVSYNIINNTKIWVNTIDNQSEIARIYKLRMWISDKVTISDTNIKASYTTKEYENKYATVKIAVDGDFKEKEIMPELYGIVETSLADNLLANDGDARIVSGEKNINNYVWYSGKLWRIVALNNDGTIKLITENNISNISWGNGTVFYNQETKVGSYIYQFLNEDFLDTLYNYEKMLKTDYSWDVTQTSLLTKPSDSNIVKAPVGLLTAYEYTESYKNAGSNSLGYLNNGYYWWLITPVTAANVRCVYYNGTLNSRNSMSNAAGVRPSINLATNVRIKGDGDGSINSPYRLEGDISEPINNVTLLNQRVSGEYIEFDSKLYRIVNIEDNITKIVSSDYIKDDLGIVSKKFGASDIYGSTNSSTCLEECDSFWDIYLNTTFKANLNDDYEKMLVEDDWYLGNYPNGVSYKNTICKESNTTETTKNCKRIENTYRGYVGLGRVGEIFTSQVGGGSSNSSTIWTITSSSNSSVLRVNNDGRLIYSNPSSDSHTIRPSMFLSSNVFIISGLGTNNSPFKISIDI